jgi:cbb3-type cytochrome c oxidase subunit III
MRQSAWSLAGVGGVGRVRRAGEWAAAAVPMLVMVLVLVMAQLCLGPTAKAADKSAAQTPAALYHNYCSVCHGDKGDGQSRARGSLNPAPRDFTTPQALQQLTRERMLAAVKGGVPGTAMVAWKSQLDDSQIAAVVDYVRDVFMRASLAADASRGRQLYAKNCSVCHGDRGAGSMWASANLRPPPRDFSSPQALVELSRERMLAAVASGRPGTAMAGFARQLSGEDISAVVDYIRLSFMREGANAGISGTHARNHGGDVGAAPQLPAATARMKLDLQLPMPQGLKGDIAAGRALYAANCATCHGMKGDGQGPRAYFINPKPRSFVSAESRALFNRPAIYASVAAGKRGSEMPSWDKVLEPQQLADVSEYLFRSFIQTAGAADVATRR